MTEPMKPDPNPTAASIRRHAGRTYRAQEVLDDIVAENGHLRAALRDILAAATDARSEGAPSTPDEAVTRAEKELVTIIDRIASIAAGVTP